MNNFAIKNNKKGFTLIELLATMVIVISILGIAIVSVMKLSEKQKENAYEKVKEQVMTAAKQYFSSNEYLFEGIDGSAYGIITVGKLVEEDYINKISNPINGKALNECDQIKVTKDENGHYILSYIELSDNSSMLCSSNNSLMIKTHEEAPEFTLEFNVADKNNDLWFNKAELSGKTLGDNSNGLFVKITTNSPDIKYCENNNGTNICSSDTKELSTNNGWQSNGKSGYYDTINFNNEDEMKSICYVVSNESGSTTNCIAAGVDITSPSIDINITHDQNKWYNTDLTYSVEATDILNNLGSLDGYWNKSGLTSSKAATEEHKWNGDEEHYKTGGTHSVTLNNSKSIIYSDINNTKFSAEGHRKLAYIVCDSVGNCRTSSEIQFKIDKSAPEVVVTTDVDTNNSAWYSKSSVNYTGVSTDTYAGLASIKSYWNKAGLTTTKADSNTYSWNGSSYPNGGSETVSVTSGSLSKTHSNTFSAEGHRKIRYVACDVAGNCSSDVKVVKIDRTPPIFVRYSGGRTNCGPNYWGYSIEFRDELTSSIAYMPEYYSSWDCGGEKTGGFYWAANHDAYKRNSSTSNFIYSVFAGCSNNPSPAARFYIIDEAGNKSSTVEVKANKSSSPYSPAADKCSELKWWNVQ